MVKKSSKINIQPLADRVLVRPDKDDKEQKTDSGIIIPETVGKDKPQQGEIIAVGEGKYDDGELIKPTVKVGDTVIFSKYGYDEIKVDDEEYYILKEDSILAVIK
jgi:chaperonin GroES